MSSTPVPLVTLEPGRSSSSSGAAPAAEKGAARDLRRAGQFVVLATALAWFAALPLWLDDAGLASPWTSKLLPLMMWAPGVATLLMLFAFAPEGNRRRLLGLGLGKRGWPWYWLFGWLAVPAFCFLALPLGELFGVYDFDPGLSAFRALVAAQVASGPAATPEGLPLSIEHLALAQLLQMVLLAPLLNAVFVLGEEVGWRGYLLPKLLPLGTWPALLVSGAVWGLWHAPVILLGYNYPGKPLLGMVLMTVLCTLFGVLFGWTRLATGSLWPAVIGHGALNGCAGLVLLLGAEGFAYDPAQAGITGWSGWILPGLWIAALLLTRRLPRPGNRPRVALPPTNLTTETESIG